MSAGIIERGARFAGGILSLALAVAVVVNGCSNGDDKNGKIIVRDPAALKAPATTTPAPVSTPAAESEAVAVAKAEPEVVTPHIVTYEEAETAYFDRSYELATEKFTAYTERKTENPWGFYMLGLSAWKSGDLERAEAAFEHALALDDTHVKSYINLSRVLLDMSRPAEAEAKIDAALALDSTSGVAHRLRGRALHQLGRTEEAIEAYRKAIELDNEDAWAMNNMALILIESSRFDEALAPLARAIELRGDVSVFQNNFGMALECTGRFRSAEAAYRTAVDIDGYAKAYENLSRVEIVVEPEGVEPVDVAALAKQFADEVSSWAASEASTDGNDVAVIQTAAPDTPQSDTSTGDDIVSGAADSTSTIER